MSSQLLDLAKSGDRRALGRLLTEISVNPEQIQNFELKSAAKTIGITGAPGVGKSTLTSALIHELVRREKKVAVLAVDPSSPITGGALLGDRIRMQAHATDENVFIRSIASGGHLGGLAKSAAAQIQLLRSLDFDYVLVETVGVGQNEVEVASVADLVLVVLAPGMGDAIQAAKAGVFEIADVFVVNKADREGADNTVAELRSMLELSNSPKQPPICKTVSTTAEGIAELLNTISAS
jgi:LAO/AO transport system kinase